MRTKKLKIISFILTIAIAGCMMIGCEIRENKEKDKLVDIIVFGGQSNMQGQTEINPADMPVQGAKEYLLLTDCFVELQNPVGEDIDDLLLASHLGSGSLVPYFVEEYIKNTDRSVVAVHVAKGATVMKEWLKNTAEGGDRYAKVVEKINRAKAKVLSEHNELGKIIYVWLQGESDALARTTRKDYQLMLTTFKDDLKEDVGIDVFGIIEVGYFSYLYGGDNAFDEEIQKAQVYLCETDKDFVYLTDMAKELSLNPEYLNPQAPGHFNNKAMKVIGKYAGKAAAEIRY